MPSQKTRHHLIPLTLNESQWCELWNALSSKASAVRRGDYGDACEDEEFYPEEWADELESVAEVLAEELRLRGILY